MTHIAYCINHTCLIGHPSQGSSLGGALQIYVCMLMRQHRGCRIAPSVLIPYIKAMSPINLPREEGEAMVVHSDLNSILKTKGH